MNPIITLTDAAVAHIKHLMQKNAKSVGFRLSIKKTGCSGYAYVPAIIDTVEPMDIHFIAQDQLKVYVDPSSEQLVKELVVDYVSDTKSGITQKRLIFLNPNEKSRCGCGESFTMGSAE